MENRTFRLRYDSAQRVTERIKTVVESGSADTVVASKTTKLGRHHLCEKNDNKRSVESQDCEICDV